MEKSVNDVENRFKEEFQPENELEKIDGSFTAEKADVGTEKKVPGDTSQLQTHEDKQPETDHYSNPEPMVSQTTIKEVKVNIDSELLNKAEAKGIDLSNTLEQQLKRMVSGN